MIAKVFLFTAGIAALCYIALAYALNTLRLLTCLGQHYVILWHESIDENVNPPTITGRYGLAKFLFAVASAIFLVPIALVGQLLGESAAHASWTLASLARAYFFSLIGALLSYALVLHGTHKAKGWIDTFTSRPYPPWFLKHGRFKVLLYSLSAGGVFFGVILSAPVAASLPTSWYILACVGLLPGALVAFTLLELVCDKLADLV
ncbi:MAG: hypothetical protein ACFFCW_33065 [Candidatus Hodarchaeota archaeon]